MDLRRPSMPLPQGTRRPGAGADEKVRGSPVKRPVASAAAARLQPSVEGAGAPGSSPGASSLIDVDFVDVVADPASSIHRGPRTQPQQPAGPARLAPPVLPTVERAPPPQSRRTSSRQRGRVVDAASSVLGSAEDRRRIRQFEWSSSDEHAGVEDDAAAQRASEEREVASKAAEAALQARVEAVLSAATSIVARQQQQQQQQQQPQPALQGASAELLPAILTEGGLSTGDSMQPQGDDSLPALPPLPPGAATLRAPTDLRDLARAVGLTPADILDGVGSRSFIAAKCQAKQAWLAAQEEAAAAAKAAAVAAAGEEAEQTEYETDYGDSSDEARAPPRRLTLAELVPSLHDASPDDIPDSMLPAVRRGGGVDATTMA